MRWFRTRHHGARPHLRACTGRCGVGHLVRRTTPKTLAFPAVHHRRSTARHLAQIAIFAALIAALGVPGTIFVGSALVPITFQTLGVMLAGAILGPRKRFLAVLTFEVLAFAGLPLLAGNRGGIVWFTTAPAAGFLWGWLAGAALMGALTARLLPRYPLWLGILATAAGGMLLISAIGIPVLAHNGHLSLGAATAADVWFLAGDSVKVVLTAVIAKQVHRAYPGPIPSRRSMSGTARQ